MLRKYFIELELIHEELKDNELEFPFFYSKRTIYIKRGFDLFVSSLLLIITFPVFLLTMICIKLDSSGPIFYKQKRVGLGNKEFSVIKFRSMKIDAEKNGAQWAQKDDDRVTKVGKIIRKIRIDELPQLINVFKNEMSLIGPRPERKVFVDELEQCIPYYNFRHKVKPGISGLAQVSYPYGSSLEDAKWKHKYDMYYIKHHSVKLDLLIFFATIKTVLFGMGR